MSCTYSFYLSCRDVYFPRVRDFATTATREQSLKDLGYDLTDPEQGDEEEKYYGVATVFYVSEVFRIIKCYFVFNRKAPIPMLIAKTCPRRCYSDDKFITFV